MRGLVTNLLAAAGADKAGHSAGLDQSVHLSRVAGTLVFIFIFIPTLIAAFDVLQIEAVSKPATEMLGRILNAVPHVVAAGLILVVTYYIARFAAALASRLLNGMGFDGIPDKLGMETAFPGSLKPSGVVGMVILSTHLAQCFDVPPAAVTVICDSGESALAPCQWRSPALICTTSPTVISRSSVSLATIPRPAVTMSN